MTKLELNECFYLYCYVEPLASPALLNELNNAGFNYKLKWIPPSYRITVFVSMREASRVAEIMAKHAKQS